MSWHVFGCFEILKFSQHSRDAPNVYEGVPKHYTGNDVTPANFLSVLVGMPGFLVPKRCFLVLMALS